MAGSVFFVLGKGVEACYDTDNPQTDRDVWQIEEEVR